MRPRVVAMSGLRNLMRHVPPHTAWKPHAAIVQRTLEMCTTGIASTSKDWYFTKRNNLNPVRQSKAQIMALECYTVRPDGNRRCAAYRFAFSALFYGWLPQM